MPSIPRERESGVSLPYCSLHARAYETRNGVRLKQSSPAGVKCATSSEHDVYRRCKQDGYWWVVVEWTP